ncbi:MAG: zinc-dependent alcohol dehydrogenase family protein [Candidatus Stahlbacteria bacterium]|nr:zinc-dependent alcohol dehydrogenase family protein [Candidatus Stahlbacteria bacterium]
MKAMILNEPTSIDNSPLKLVELPIPTPKPTELLIKISVCGICHTDLHEVEGNLPLIKKPIIPGHQIIGRVESKGKMVTRFKIGDRIGIAWLHSTCGECKFCKSNNENLCDKAFFTGYNVDGGYAQYTVIREDFVYPIPEIFIDREAAPLLCAGIIGYRALRSSKIKPGNRLGLYGFGASAHIAIQIAVHWGCEVYVFTRSHEHQKLAKKLGCVWVGDTTHLPPHKLDSTIIFAPAGELVLNALESLEKGGTVALAGIYMTPIPEMEYNKYLYHEKTICSVTNSTRTDGEELLKLSASIPIKPETTIFPLEEANQALQLLKHRQITGAGIIEIG